MAYRGDASYRHWLALGVVAVLLSSCGQMDQKKKRFPREKCVERCIYRVVDHLSDADHLQGISAETFEGIEDACRRHYECSPCSGDYWPVGDAPVWPCEESREGSAAEQEKALRIGLVDEGID